MNTKHTPGPWKVEQRFSGNRFIHSDNSQSPICRVAFVGMGIGVDESKANADLIAAAPELLEALENLLDAVRQNIDGKPPTADQIFEIGGHAAVAAIAKATGAA